VKTACARAYDAPVTARPYATRVTFDGRTSDEFAGYRTPPKRPVRLNPVPYTMTINGFTNLGTRTECVSIMTGTGYGFAAPASAIKAASKSSMLRGLPLTNLSRDDASMFSVADANDSVETIEVAPGETILYDATCIMRIPFGQVMSRQPPVSTVISSGIGALESSDLRKTYAFWVTVSETRGAKTPDMYVRRWDKYLATGLAPPCSAGHARQHAPTAWRTTRTKSLARYLSQFGFANGIVSFSREKVVAAHAPHRKIYETDAVIGGNDSDDDEEEEEEKDEDDDSDSDDYSVGSDD
jgi:hypothetical protein